MVSGTLDAPADVNCFLRLRAALPANAMPAPRRSCKAKGQDEFARILVLVQAKQSSCLFRVAKGLLQPGFEQRRFALGVSGVMDQSIKANL